MGLIAIIGGSGLARLARLEIEDELTVETPYGATSCPVLRGRLAGCEVLFLARHGSTHTIPPHRINYRANLWALNAAGARRVIAVAAVGGIASELAPGDIALPDQIIDYTSRRGHTYFEDGLDSVTHIDFTEPYCAELRAQLLAAARRIGMNIHAGGTYGATQGPRLETAAEIDRMERDGCTMVGMTGMPEAALARELGLRYTACAVVANRAAGRGTGPITMTEIEATLTQGISRVATLIEAALPDLCVGD